jgi:hypothetical protein
MQGKYLSKEYPHSKGIISPFTMIDIVPPWERREASDLFAGFFILTKGNRSKGKEAKRFYSYSIY